MQTTKIISQCTNKSNKCSTSLLLCIALYCFCILWCRLLSLGENSDFSLRSVTSHIILTEKIPDHACIISYHQLKILLELIKPHINSKHSKKWIILVGTLRSKASF